MPAQEIAFLNQRAVLWCVTGTDRYGQPTITDAPIEVPVAWTTQRNEIPSKDGTSVGLGATAIVDRRIAIESLMWLGNLSDWPDGQDPRTAADGTEVMVVKSYTETPDLKKRHATRSVGLMRYREQPPNG